MKSSANNLRCIVETHGSNTAGVRVQAREAPAAPRTMRLLVVLNYQPEVRRRRTIPFAKPASDRSWWRGVQATRQRRWSCMQRRYCDGDSRRIERAKVIEQTLQEARGAEAIGNADGESNQQQQNVLAQDHPEQPRDCAPRARRMPNSPVAPRYGIGQQAVDSDA